MHKTALLALTILLSLPLSAQEKSAKRGISWDEKTQVLTDATLSKMAPGISWLYNWGIKPTSTSALIGPEGEIEFAPMCWNGSFDETALRNYLNTHPGVKYLLGFNEPNLTYNVGGCQMTPRQAAAVWPRLERIATDFNLKLVAPALNYSGDAVGGKVYNTPFDWLEEFIALYPTARMDYVCLHCYMDYASANKWFATEYFYGNGSSDLYSSANKAKYPKLIEYFETYGEKPMFLTEFCAFGNDFRPNNTAMNLDNQIDHLTQKLQYLEQSDKVAGYAWFIGNGNAGNPPYNSVFQTNQPPSDLSTLGKVYVYMSSFDKDKFYVPSEEIKAKDYIDASLNDQQVRLRPNTEAATAAGNPLQVEFQPSAWASYQLEIPTEGKYKITLHIKSSADNAIWFYVDGKNKLKSTVASTGNVWADKEINLTLPAGRHTLMIFNTAQTSFYLNSLNYAVTDGIEDITTAKKIIQRKYYSLNGSLLNKSIHGICIERSVDADGNTFSRKVHNRDL